MDFQSTTVDQRSAVNILDNCDYIYLVDSNKKRYLFQKATFKQKRLHKITVRLIINTNNGWIMSSLLSFLF